MLKRRSMLAGTAGWTIVGASACGRRRGRTGRSRSSMHLYSGGATDTAGRLVAEKMTALLGQQVIVENRGGGNTIIGMELVAKAKPDGQTFCWARQRWRHNAALGLKQPYDPLKDFQPISTLADIPDLIAYNNDVPAKNWAEFADWVNTSSRRRCALRLRALATSRISGWSCSRRATSSTWRSWPTRARPKPFADVLAGHVADALRRRAATATHVKAGRLKGLVVASAERSPMCPDVPTVVELGMPDMVSAVFYGLVAPAGTPRPVVERLNALCQEIIKDAEVKKKFGDLGFFMTGSTPGGLSREAEVRDRALDQGGQGQRHQGRKLTRLF